MATRLEGSVMKFWDQYARARRDSAMKNNQRKSKRSLAAVAPPASPPEVITNKTPSPPAIKEIGGSGVYVWDMMMIDRTASTSPTFMADGEDYTKKMAAIALRSFEPADAVEGMLAAQAVALHHASLECSRRAMLQGQPGEIASKLRKDAANSARAMVDMIEALDRRRGKGSQQFVRVERVVVNEGGQAVVGVMAPGTPSVTSRVAQQAIAHGVSPFSTGDALPVIADDVRGEGE